uniref:Cell wall integrity and stress response component 2-like n=1 Tax=Diabrotica virgifera virgifera TaxID=50390 RepID=A0A6P7FU56_DIAVI
MECYTCIATRYEHNRCQRYATKHSLPVIKCHENATHCVSFFNDDIVARTCGTAHTCDETNSVECHLCTESYCNFHNMYRRRYIRQAENNEATNTTTTTAQSETTTTTANAQNSSTTISSTAAANAQTSSSSTSASNGSTTTAANTDTDTASSDAPSTTSNLEQTAPAQESTSTATSLFQSVFTIFVIVSLLCVF